MTQAKCLTETPTARLFLDAFRTFENDLASTLQTRGYTDITSGNFNVMRHLNPEGMRLTELAHEAQISKQAIGKMIAELETKGYVQLTPDESDGRAKFVSFSQKGEQLIALAVEFVKEIEDQYQSILGKNNYQQLRDMVWQIQNWHLKKGT